MDDFQSYSDSEETFNLILWKIGKTTSIVEKRDIRIGAKDRASARWGSKFYPVKILRESKDREELEKLKCTTDGQAWTPGKNIKTPKNLNSINFEKVVEKKSQPSPDPPNSRTENCSTCETCSEFLRDPIVKRYLEHQLEHIRKTTGVRKELDYSTSTSSTSDSVSTVHVELVPHSGIYLSPIDLEHIKKRFKYNAKEMTRRLFEAIIGTEKLKSMCRTGKNNLQEIPRKVYSTILDFVKLQSWQEISTEKFDRYVTEICNTMRPNRNEKNSDEERREKEEGERQEKIKRTRAMLENLDSILDFYN